MAGSLIQANRTLRLQRNDLALRLQRDRNAQAEMVTALTDLVRDENGDPTDVYEAIVYNRGDDMVFDVLVQLPEGQSKDVGAHVVANYDRCGHGDMPKAMSGWPRRIVGTVFPRLDVTFTDIHGVRWHRGIDQKLEELS